MKFTNTVDSNEYLKARITTEIAKINEKILRRIEYVYKRIAINFNVYGSFL